MNTNKNVSLVKTSVDLFKYDNNHVHYVAKPVVEYVIRKSIMALILQISVDKVYLVSNNTTTEAKQPQRLTS